VRGGRGEEGRAGRGSSESVSVRRGRDRRGRDEEGQGTTKEGRDAPDPRQRLVSALLDNLEVPHLDARDGEVGDLILDRDRRALVELLCVHERRLSAVEPTENSRREGEEDAPPRTLGKPKCARMRNSLPPASCLILHTNADFSGT